MTKRLNLFRCAPRSRVCEKLTPFFAQSFTREMTIWAALDHPNILPFIGFMLDGFYLSFVSEWMVLGSLRDFLKKDSTECSWYAHIARYQRFSIEKFQAFGIAEGLRYLHDKDIVHSDIKSVSIGINSSTRMKSLIWTHRTTS